MQVMTSTTLFPILVERQRAHYRRFALYCFSFAALFLIAVMDDGRPWRGILAGAIVAAIAGGIWFIGASRRLFRIPAIVELLDNTAQIDVVNIDGVVAHVYLRSNNRVKFVLRGNERDDVMHALRTHSPDARIVEDAEFPTATIRRSAE
jgi:hypothetical protein